MSEVEPQKPKRTACKCIKDRVICDDCGNLHYPLCLSRVPKNCCTELKKNRKMRNLVVLHYCKTCVARHNAFCPSKRAKFSHAYCIICDWPKIGDPDIAKRLGDNKWVCWSCLDGKMKKPEVPSLENPGCTCAKQSGECHGYKCLSEHLIAHMTRRFKCCDRAEFGLSLCPPCLQEHKLRCTGKRAPRVPCEACSEPVRPHEWWAMEFPSKNKQKIEDSKWICLKCLKQ